MAVQLEFLKSILSDGGSLCGDGKQMGFGVDGHLNKVGSAEGYPQAVARALRSQQ